MSMLTFCSTVQKKLQVLLKYFNRNRNSKITQTEIYCLRMHNPSPILSIIHTVTIGTMLNNDGLKKKLIGVTTLHLDRPLLFEIWNYLDNPYFDISMQVYVRDCTMVSVYPLLLFGGGNLTIDLFKSNFILSLDDGWIRFMVTTKEVSASIANTALD